MSSRGKTLREIMNSDEYRDCSVCNTPITGDVMAPEGEGPMHIRCWREWITAEVHDE